MNSFLILKKGIMIAGLFSLFSLLNIYAADTSTAMRGGGGGRFDSGGRSYNNNGYYRGSYNYENGFQQGLEEGYDLDQQQYIVPDENQQQNQYYQEDPNAIAPDTYINPV